MGRKTPNRTFSDGREDTALDIDQRIAKFFAGDQSVRLPESLQITEAESDDEDASSTVLL